MRLTVTSVTEPETGRVSFESRYGCGVGFWQGTLPTVGNRYEVEFGVEEVLRLGVDLVSVQEASKPSVMTDGLGTSLIGELLQIDQDGTAAARIGESVLLFEMKGRVDSLPSWVRLGPLRLLLYDSNC